MNFKKFAIVYHLHFPDLIPELISLFGRFESYTPKFLTVTDQISNDQISVIEKSLKNLTIRRVRNNGRDIKPLLDLAKDGSLDDFDWILKVHGKKSSHRVDGDYMRRYWTELLAPEAEPFKTLNLSGELSSNVRLLAPRNCLLYPTTDRNWISNVFWIEKILNRIDAAVKYNLDIKSWYYPILSGSFYFLSKAGINYLKELPCSELDWGESEESGPKIDGLLEHAIERLMIMSLYPSKGQKDDEKYSLFEYTLDGKFKKFELPCINPYNTSPKKYNSIVKSQLQTYIPNSQQNDFILNVDIKYAPNRTYVQCLLFDTNKKNTADIYLDIRVKGLTIASVQVKERYSELCLPALLTGQYKASATFYGTIPKEDIQICFPNNFQPIKSIGIEFFTATAKQSAYLSYQSLSSICSSESTNLNPKPLSKLARDSKKISDICNIQAERFWSNRKSIEKPTLNIFLINNCYTALSALRTIEYLDLAPQDILIVFHRTKPIDILNRYKYIETCLPDLECNLDSKQISEVFFTAKEILKFIPDVNFALHSYHYYSLLSAVIAWSPRCNQVNLLEEGNLNFSNLHNFYRLASLANFEYFVEKCDFRTAKSLNYFLYQSIKITKSILFGTLSAAIPKYIVGDQLEYSDVEALNMIQRDYFYHPKMALGSFYFRISGISNGTTEYFDHSQVSIASPSLPEKKILRSYRKWLKDFTVNYTVCMVLPSVTPNHDLFIEALSELKESFCETVFDVVYIKHPAANNNFDWDNFVITTFSQFFEIKNISITSAPEGVLSDLFCSVFDTVIHCNSSIVRIASSLNPSIHLFNLGKL